MAYPDGKGSLPCYLPATHNPHGRRAAAGTTLTPRGRDLPGSKSFRLRIDVTGPTAFEEESATQRATVAVDVGRHGREAGRAACENNSGPGGLGCQGWPADWESTWLAHTASLTCTAHRDRELHRRTN